MQNVVLGAFIKLSFCEGNHKFVYLSSEGINDARICSRDIGAGIIPGVNNPPGFGNPAGLGKPPEAGKPAGSGNPPEADKPAGSGNPPSPFKVGMCMVEPPSSC